MFLSLKIIATVFQTNDLIFSLLIEAYSEFIGSNVVHIVLPKRTYVNKEKTEIIHDIRNRFVYNSAVEMKPFLSLNLSRTDPLSSSLSFNFDVTPNPINSLATKNADRKRNILLENFLKTTGVLCIYSSSGSSYN